MIDGIGSRRSGKSGIKHDFGLEHLLFNEMVAARRVEHKEARVEAERSARELELKTVRDLFLWEGGRFCCKKEHLF